MGTYRYYGDISESEKMYFEQTMNELESYMRFIGKGGFMFDMVTANDIDYWCYGEGKNHVDIITELPVSVNRNYTKSLAMIISKAYTKSQRSLQVFKEEIDTIAQRFHKLEQEGKKNIPQIVYHDSD